MAKTPSRIVLLAISEADAALTVLERLLAEKMHADDRKDIDTLITKAREALDRAQIELADAVRAIREALDRI